jgi:hypothetical protein
MLRILNEELEDCELKKNYVICLSQTIWENYSLEIVANCRGVGLLVG